MAICAFAIIKNKDKVLLVRIAPPFAEAKKWSFPGGVIEHNEDMPEGLVREVFEETNLICSVDNIRDKFTTDTPPNEINIFNATFISGDIIIQDSEISEAKWFTKDEALDLTLAFNTRNYISSMDN